MGGVCVEMLSLKKMQRAPWRKRKCGRLWACNVKIEKIDVRKMHILMYCSSGWCPLFGYRWHDMRADPGDFDFRITSAGTVKKVIKKKIKQYLVNRSGDSLPGFTAEGRGEVYPEIWEERFWCCPSPRRDETVGKLLRSVIPDHYAELTLTDSVPGPNLKLFASLLFTNLLCAQMPFITLESRRKRLFFCFDIWRTCLTFIFLFFHKTRTASLDVILWLVQPCYSRT